ncbi:hypothetical protein EMCRGX_G005632 [Ephydatia muelleri]
MASGGQGVPRVEDEVHIYGISTAYHLLTLSNDPIVTDVACEALGTTARKHSQGTLSPQEFLNSPPQKGFGDIRSVRKRCGETILDTSCPKYYLEQETLAHVLNHCPPHAVLVRRTRHNKILKRLANAVPETKGVKIQEQVIPGDTTALRPHLVILNEARSEAYVVDVTVPFEGEEVFQAACRAIEEIDAYLKPLMRAKGFRKVDVFKFSQQRMYYITAT